MSKAEPAEQDPVSPFEHKLAIQAWWGYNGRAQQAGVKASLQDFLAGWEARQASAPNTDGVDAARYRALRRGQHWSVIDGAGYELRAETLDAAVDAATKERP